jgi:hypothetical protein
MTEHTIAKEPTEADILKVAALYIKSRGDCLPQYHPDDLDAACERTATALERQSVVEGWLPFNKAPANKTVLLAMWDDSLKDSPSEWIICWASHNGIGWCDEDGEELHPSSGDLFCHLPAALSGGRDHG